VPASHFRRKADEPFFSFLGAWESVVQATRPILTVVARTRHLGLRAKAERYVVAAREACDLPKFLALITRLALKLQGQSSLWLGLN
jgi:hypothetical protein